MGILASIRSIMRAPVFAAAAVLTIAIGIGLNTAVFSLIYATLLEPLPFRDPSHLVYISETHPDFAILQVGALDFKDWRASAKNFEQMAAYTFRAVNKWTLNGEGETEMVQVTQASHELFPMMGIRPMLGRAYTGEEEASKAPVVMISESLWRRKLGADPNIVGRKIRLIDWPVTVVGVISKRQAHPAWADVWSPITFLDPALTESHRFHALEVVARLKPSATLEQAQIEMQSIAAVIGKSNPETNGKIGAAVMPLSAFITGEIRPALLMLWAAVGLVLLLACGNVAHLVMVRAVDRSKEMAVRAALGANSWQLARMLLLENLILASLGGVLGALLAIAVSPVLPKFAAVEIPRFDGEQAPIIPLLFAAAATLVCALLFAAPAVFQTRITELHQAIKQSGGLSLGHRRSPFGRIIIASEVAMAFVVIAATGLLYRSFTALLNENAGFDPRGVLAVDVPIGFTADSQKLLDQKILPAVRLIPGVTSVAAVNTGPMMLRSNETSRFASRFGLPGESYPRSEFPSAQMRWISVDYFKTLRIPLKKGRLFTEDDKTRPGCLINESLARRYFPNADPVGRNLLMNVVTPTPNEIPILGVVGDVRDLTLDTEPRPTIYTLGVANQATLLIAADVNPLSLLPVVRAAIRQVNPEEPIRRAGSLQSMVEESIAKRKFALYLFGIFGAVAALLTFIGVYGVISYSLRRRSNEFAIRLAMGARRADLRWLIARNFGVPAAAGLAAGLWMAVLFASALKTQLYKLSPNDPMVLAATSLGLLILIVISATGPAGRAERISPASILRD